MVLLLTRLFRLQTALVGSIQGQIGVNGINFGFTIELIDVVGIVARV